MPIPSEARTISGILLVSVPTIALGGAFLLRMLKGSDPGYVNNPLRQNMFRAGHAHAGIMVILSLLCQLFADSVVLPGGLHLLARLGVPCAAVLMPLGFFLSVASPVATRPNRLIGLIYVGALLVVTSVLTLGVGLLLPLSG
jgi:hypothetical protein